MIYRTRAQWSIEPVVQGWKCRTWMNNFFNTQIKQYAWNRHWIIIIDQWWLLTIFWRVLRQIQANQSSLLTTPSNISQLIHDEWHKCDRGGKDIYSCFYESKKLLVCLMQRETCQLEIKQSMVKIYFLKLLLIHSR